MEHINIENLLEFLSSRNIDTSELQRHLADYIDLSELDYNIKEYPIVKDEWSVSSGNTNSSQRHGAYESIWLNHTNNEYPFKIRLALLTTTGKPVIGFYVVNKYSLKTSFQKELELKTRIKQKTLRQEIKHYWDNGSVLRALSPEIQERNLVPFSIAMQALNGILLDAQDKKLSVTASKAIAYLYAQIVNKSATLLSEEPINWNIPAGVTARMSSGLVDSIQDSLVYSKADNSQPSYRDFIKNYPTLESFAKSFDSNYM